MVPSYGAVTNSLSDGFSELPSDSDLAPLNLDMRFLLMTMSSDGRSSGVWGETGDANAWSLAFGSLSTAASAIFLIVGRVFLTNWLLVMCCSSSARWRSVLSMRIEKAM